jgi:hypothetical protein
MIKPITLHDSTAAYLWRVLYASRYLQVPEGRAFLLAQLRRRLAMLPFDGTTGQPATPPCRPFHESDASGGASGCSLAAATAPSFLASLEAACAYLHMPLEPPPSATHPLPPLSLHWPSSSPVDQPDSAAMYPPAAYPPPVIILGDFLDLII